MSCDRSLVVSDLDGTLLGDDDALARFADWCCQHRPRFSLVYATGRTFASVQAAIASTPLPVPDAVITSVGTAIQLFPSGAALMDWPQADHHWDPQKVCRQLQQMPRLSLQPEEFQSPWKVSWFLKQATAAELQEVHERLTQAELKFETIYSCQEFLDILPAQVNKGSAVRALARHWTFPDDQVIVCGDTENDMAMFRQEGFRGVIVGNAQVELRQLQGPHILLADGHFADGVIEGLSHWLHSSAGPAARRQQQGVTDVAVPGTHS